MSPELVRRQVNGCPLVLFGCSGRGLAIRSGHVIAIPESGSVVHVKENAVALRRGALTDTDTQELQTLHTAHPPPGR